MKIKNIIIIGPGLIGGSIAKSLRKCGQKFHLTAVCKNKSETLEVEKLKIFDKITSGIYSSLFVETDLVLVCSPVSTISKIINKISGFIKNNCIVSDVGSIKHNIYKGLTAESKKKYIGSHPMTGSEKSGVKNSESSILENAVVIVTKTRESGKTDILRLTEFWKFMKCEVHILDVKTHDLIVAYISHLPHLTAASLVKTSGITFLKTNKINILPFAGGGFKDSTRIAAGNPDLWTDIFANNKKYVLAAVNSFLSNLNQFKKLLETNDLKKIKQFLSASAKTRDTLQSQVKRIIKLIYEIVINVDDKPGVIGKIAMLLGKNKINIKYIEVLYVRDNEPGSIKIGVNSRNDMEKAFKILTINGFKAYQKD